MARLTTAMPDITSHNCVNPAALTAGPSTATASELMPKETAMRVPLTRERNESSM